MVFDPARRVLSLMRATRSERWACRATSATLSRDGGKPKVAGNSHASALISTVSSGGKAPRASRACSLTGTRQSLLEEALAPLADRHSGQAALICFVVIVQQNNTFSTKKQKKQQLCLPVGPGSG